MLPVDTDGLGRVQPGTDAALKLLLATPGVDVESARKWLRDALGCLEEPLDGCSVGNADNQAAKAMVALGQAWVWTYRPEQTPQPEDVDVYELRRPAEFETDRDWAGACLERAWIAEDRLAAAEGALEDIERAAKGWRAEQENSA